jgi:outer membrane protein
MTVEKSGSMGRFKPFRMPIAALAACAALVGAPAAAVELKIGYVNAIKVIEEAPQGEAALKKLEAEFGPRDKQLVEMQNKIKELEADLEKNAFVLKEPERRSKEHEIVALKRDLRRATQEFREDYNLRRNEELAALQKIVYKAIVEIAKQENYDLILHEGTIYASGKIDITAQVLKKLGKKN